MAELPPLSAASHLLPAQAVNFPSAPDGHYRKPQATSTSTNAVIEVNGISHSLPSLLSVVGFLLQRYLICGLRRCQWDGEVKGFRAGGAVDNLARWLTKDWLTTDHEDQMLELSASDLGISDGSTSCVQSTYFVHALAQAYEDPATYRAASRFAWLRRPGIAFATKQRLRLGTIVNEDENHWTALTIDCEAKLVGYGNGFLTKAPASLRRHLDWWLYEHPGPNSSGSTYLWRSRMIHAHVESSTSHWRTGLIRRDFLFRLLQPPPWQRNVATCFYGSFSVIGARRVLELEEDEDGLELEGLH
ncbi:hypothetical protein R3P38DRAFT_2813484 [Favolaschia claudopus]|uniref:Ubiquitin-like protease family profile domain-containing protein n=1 Tax=Favolaschia claudopus TaxID=2862362 RepID=A0AAV9Z659_9AGAR